MQNNKNRKIQINYPKIVAFWFIFIFSLTTLVTLITYFFTDTKEMLVFPQPYSISQKTEDKLHWIKYVDIHYNFSFSYPSYFKYIYPNPIEWGGAYFAPREGEGDKKGTPIALTDNDVWLVVMTIPVKKNISLKEYINTSGAGVFRNDYAESKLQIIKIGGIDGYKITQENSTPYYMKSTTVFYEGMVKKEDRVYTLNLSSYNKNALKSFSTIFDRILSSFEFL